MTRDEILAAIEAIGREPDGNRSLADRIADVSLLADAYLNSEAGDAQYLAESLMTALDRFGATARRMAV